MTAKDLAVNYRGHREAVEAICKRFPELDVVPSLALQSISDVEKFKAQPKLDKTH